MQDNDRLEERHRHEKFMVDDDREKPDRLPDDPAEYLENGDEESLGEQMRSVDDEDLSAEMLSDENEDEDLSDVARPVTSDEEETDMQIVTDENDLPADTVDELIDDERRFLSLDALAELSGAIENVRGMLGNIRTVIEAPRQGSDADPVAQQTAPLSAPEIEFRNVSFSYGDADSEPLFSDLNLQIPAGASTAIVGPSGSGKSTILGLIAGLYTPSSGAVLINGTPTTELSYAQRDALFSMVFQHPYLFAGSIADNIAVGHSESSEAERDEAMRLARVDEIAQRLEGGINSNVGEAGTGLSGGERQRISIARALLKPAPVLLIDEATSALDTENEAAITRALTVDSAERTRVIVAHRLSSIRAVDRVLFIEQGRLIEQGTVAELSTAGGRFSTFWQQQEQSVGWKLTAHGAAGQ